MPSFTIALCNYNYGRFLAQALDSALAQDWPKFDIVAVDDGSTDDSVEILRRYQSAHSSRLRFISHGRNRGQAAAFNSAIAEASGDFITFLDSDDIMLPHKLSTLTRWLEAAGPGFGVVQHLMELHDERGQSLGLYGGHLLAGDLRSQPLLLDQQLLPTIGLTLARPLAKRLCPIPENISNGADSYLAACAALHSRFLAVPLPLAIYRIHGGNDSLVNARIHADERFPKVIQPAIDAHYSDHQASFNSLSRMQVGLLRQVWARLESTPEIAIYGAGAHTAKLSRAVAGRPGPQVVQVLDDQPQGKTLSFGLEVEALSRLRPGLPLLISSDRHHAAMSTKARSLYPAITIINPYEE